MRKILNLTLLLAFFSTNSFSQVKHTISGYIKDANNGEALIGAAVFVESLKTGKTANEYGFYSLTIPEGQYKLSFTYLGYKTEIREIDLKTNLKISIELKEEVRESKEVVITAVKEDANIKSVEMSVAKMDIKTISKIPPLFGEVDVIRSVQLLPGVTTVGEGASGFNVRGGAIDQNLILLDEAPVYNSSHLFGFFSVFNPDAVKDVKLIKGGIPAQYGGRLSSILDIRMKEGNNKKYELNGGIGLLSSRFSVEGPIDSNRASFILAGRRTYFDLFFPLSSDEGLKNAIAYFYDLTAKVNYRIDERNTVFLSGYFGRDKFGFGSAFGFDWGNGTTTLRWNHVFGDRLFSNLTAFYSNYDYGLNISADEDGFYWKSNIQNYSIKPEFTYFINQNNTLTFGGQVLGYNFLPGQTTVKSNGESVENSLDRKYALENGIYVSNEQQVSKRLSLQYGIRYSFFNYLGSGSKLILGDTTPGIKRPVEEVRKIGSGQSIANYGNWEPRFSLKFELDEKSSIKASYNRMAQYIHLLSNTQASVPLDVWTPSTNNIKPQVADQVAGGYFRNLRDNEYEFSAEVYYKTMQNQIDYVDGADLLLNKSLEADLLNGKGRAYGLELFLKKKKGKFTGWVSYTLARTERQVVGINQAQWYPSRFDKLHNFYLVGMYQINDRWNVSGNFIFSSGTPGTFPTNRVEYQGFVYPHNADDKRNNYRIPAYHRLDLSATYEPKANQNRKWKGSWTFAVYNVYANKNPFGIYFQQTPAPENAVGGNRVFQPTTTEAVRFSVLGIAVPSVTYNFTF